MSLNPFGFIGAGGNISRAILSGILQKDYIKPKNIYIYDLFPEKCEYATKSGVTLCKDEAETAKGCRYLFLCVKPQQMDIVLERISPVLRENHCLVSVAAGITIEHILQKTRKNTKVIRVMPNTPLLLGCGASALCRNDAVTDGEFSEVCEIFRLSGDIETCQEEQMNAVIAVSGSSPAYVFKLAKNVAEEGERLGLPYVASLHLFAQTLIGSAKMLTESGMTADELIQMVCSPGGTTLAALSYFDAHEFDDTIRGGMRQSVQRAEELSRGE